MTQKELNTYAGIGGGMNTFVPTATNWQAGGLLLVEYSRNVRSFPINRYAQLVPVSAPIGLWPQINPVDAFRLVGTNQNVWPEGSDAPEGKDQQVQWNTYTTTRYAYPFQFSSKAAQVAAWDVVASHARQKAQLAMTDRTRAALAVLTTSGNWPTTNYAATAGAITGGGSWSSSSTTQNYIQNTIRGVGIQVEYATGGAVTLDDLNLIISPAQCKTMVATAEIQAYLVNNVNTLGYLTGNDPTYNKYGLPSKLFGVNVIVENTISNTVVQGAATQTTGYLLGATTALFTARMGGLMGQAEVPQGVNTIQINAFEDMTVEQMDDTWNRTTKGRVVQDIAPVLAAPLSGFYIASTAS